MKQSYKLKGISYKWLLWVFITYNSSFITHNCFAQTTVQITPEGNKLKQLHVENLWLPGHHVNWETGEPDKPEATKGNKTHCSAFVASVCKQLDIYMIHPPSKTSLANAQYNWLFSEEGYSKGWRQIKDPIFETVQRYANMGMVVVAVCKNPNPDKPGHIALVMPTEKTPEELTNEGPTVIQAGHINSSAVSLKQGFALHLTGWNPPPTEIEFFYHEEGKK
jgi:hypothetical protein